MRLEVLTVRTQKGACSVCGVWAEVQQGVCPTCLASPEEARLLLEARMDATGRRAHAAWLHLNRCVDLLNPEEGEKWGRARQALDAYHRGEADAETEKRVRTMQTLIDKGKVSPGLAVAWVAYEHCYWAQGTAEAERRKATAALSDLARAAGEESHA